MAGMFVGSQMERNRANNNINVENSQTHNFTAGDNGSTYRGGNNNYTSTARHEDYTSMPPKDPVNPYRMQTRIWSVIAVILLVITVIMGITYFQNSNQNTRNKLDVLTAYDSDCIIDNDYWFDNVSRTEKELKDFYNKTGVQPYIVINSYNPEFTTDSEKTEYAVQWYDKNIDNECSFLYMYFPESNPDEVGYMSYVVGKQAESVLDTDVIDTFFENLDNNWYTDKSTFSGSLPAFAISSLSSFSALLTARFSKTSMTIAQARKKTWSETARMKSTKSPAMMKGSSERLTIVMVRIITLTPLSCTVLRLRSITTRQKTTSKRQTR